MILVQESNLPVTREFLKVAQVLLVSCGIPGTRNQFAQ